MHPFIGEMGLDRTANCSAGALWRRCCRIRHGLSEVRLERREFDT